jgi:hypothetical protein
MSVPISEGGAGSPSRSEFQAAPRPQTQARSESEPHLRATRSGAKPSRLWLWFVVAFLIQAAAWTAWLVIASHHKVQEVPLAIAR